MAADLTQWTGSLHQTFRLFPLESMSPNLRPFLAADGHTEQQVLNALPYHAARSQRSGATGPDPKRFRDGKQVYSTIGLLYQGDDRLVHVTELGEATLRWLDIINQNNSVILARHAAYALAACQLRNPTGAGKRYSESMVVFPFQFIWRAMLQLDGMIDAEELNRGIFKVSNEEELESTIQAIANARDAGDLTLLGDEVITDKNKNDRIIPWMSLASFGWSLFPDKRGGENKGYWELADETRAIIKEASRIKRTHKEFTSTEQYVKYVSRCSALPKDLR